MRKKTIAIFLILSVVVAIVGGIIYGVGIAGAVSTATVGTDGSTAVSAGLVGLALVGLLVIILSVIINLVAWIGALIATGKQGRWGWFCCVFFLSGLGELIYLIAGPAAQ
jgi:tellurite resistance protein TehA-like permease